MSLLYTIPVMGVCIYFFGIVFGVFMFSLISSSLFTAIVVGISFWIGDWDRGEGYIIIGALWGTTLFMWLVYKGVFG